MLVIRSWTKSCHSYCYIYRTSIHENSLKTKQATIVYTTLENPAYGDTKLYTVTPREYTAYQANELDVKTSENLAYGATELGRC